MFNLAPDCPVFQAEIMAFQQVSLALLDDEDQREIIFMVDSSVALQSLVAMEISSRQVKETILLLNEAGKSRWVSCQWVKVHAGTEGNELADKTAKEGALSNYRVGVGAPLVEIRNKIEENFYTQ